MKLCSDVAELSDFIESLPGQYDYIIDENGGNLSGGQRQRLCNSSVVYISLLVY